MKKAISIFSLLIAVATHCPAQGLKDAYRDLWLTGVSVNQWEVAAETAPTNKHDVTGMVSGDQTANWTNVEKHFDCVVAENCMKSEVIHPEEGIYDFTLADEFVNKALASGLKVHGHALIWHSQCAKWFHTDKDGKLVSAEELKRRMRDHITTIVSHFKGRVTSWDVVNEAFEDDGSPRKSLFWQILGTDYIPLAFQYAHEADPDAVLIYNDFSMNKRTKIEAVANFFRPLVNAGLPIHAIGLQGHMILEDGKKVLDQYDQSLSIIESLGLKAQFSELDLSVLPNPYGFSGANISDRFSYSPEKDPYKDGLTPEKEAEIADFWLSFYKVMLKHKGTIQRLGFWCTNDANSWRNDFPIKGRTDYATLFDRQNRPKPFIQDIISLVKPQCCKDKATGKKAKKGSKTKAKKQ